MQKEQKNIRKPWWYYWLTDIPLIMSIVALAIALLKKGYV